MYLYCIVLYCICVRRRVNFFVKIFRISHIQLVIIEKLFVFNSILMKENIFCWLSSFCHAFYKLSKLTSSPVPLCQYSTYFILLQLLALCSKSMTISEEMIFFYQCQFSRRKQFIKFRMSIL